MSIDHDVYFLQFTSHFIIEVTRHIAPEVCYIDHTLHDNHTYNQQWMLSIKTKYKGFGPLLARLFDQNEERGWIELHNHVVQMFFVYNDVFMDEGQIQTAIRILDENWKKFVVAAYYQQDAGDRDNTHVIKISDTDYSVHVTDHSSDTISDGSTGHVSDTISDGSTGHVSDTISDSSTGHVSDTISDSSTGHISDTISDGSTDHFSDNISDGLKGHSPRRGPDSDNTTCSHVPKKNSTLLADQTNFVARKTGMQGHVSQPNESVPPRQESVDKDRQSQLQGHVSQPNERVHPRQETVAKERPSHLQGHVSQPNERVPPRQETVAKEKDSISTQEQTHPKSASPRQRHVAEQKDTPSTPRITDKQVSGRKHNETTRGITEKPHFPKHNNTIQTVGPRPHPIVSEGITRNCGKDQRRKHMNNPESIDTDKKLLGEPSPALSLEEQVEKIHFSPDNTDSDGDIDVPQPEKGLDRYIIGLLHVIHG